LLLLKTIALLNNFNSNSYDTCLENPLHILYSVQPYKTVHMIQYIENYYASHPSTFEQSNNSKSPAFPNLTWDFESVKTDISL